MPLSITIGIPGYNRPDFIRQALLSALGQNYPNLQILVTDDCSPQELWPALEDLASPAWTFHRHTKNLGGTGSFNYLIQHATGDLFVLHQDDDLLHPEFCRRAAEAFVAHPEASFYSGQLWRGKNPLGVLGVDLTPIAAPWVAIDARLETPVVIPSLDALLMVLVTLPFMHPAIAMRRDLLNQVGGYFNEFMFASDNITLGKILLHGPAIYDPRTAGFYRLHSTNVSTNAKAQVQHACRRKVVSLLLPEIEKRYPNWRTRMRELLQLLPRRQRWKILTEVLEIGMPQNITAVVASSISPRPFGQTWTIARARLMKAKWRHQLRSLAAKP